VASLLDLTKERDAHILERLQKDEVIWLNSVRPDGRPHAVIVWFLWDNDTVLVFSRPVNQKIRNISNNANVVLAFDDSKNGADPITIDGTATLLPAGDLDTTYPAYIAKYGEGMKRIGYTPEQMAAAYSQGIRIVLTRVS
jgi:PPOX class probable F420-dependent enzyme